MSGERVYWSTRSERISFEASSRGFGPALVEVWAGDELDPAYLTPDEARRAADEWPAILRRLADIAESVAAGVGENQEAPE